jgi:hypothetical protein
VPGAGTDPVSVLAAAIQVPYPLHEYPEVRASALLAALRESGYSVVPAERIADLERRNENLGRLAAGGAPAGYALVRAEDVL